MKTYSTNMESEKHLKCNLLPMYVTVFLCTSTDKRSVNTHACRGEYTADDAAQSHQELPQRHVLLADRHHQ